MALNEFSTNGSSHDPAECTPVEIEENEAKNGPLLLSIPATHLDRMKAISQAGSAIFTNPGAGISSTTVFHDTELHLDDMPSDQEGEKLYGDCTSFEGRRLVQLDTEAHLRKYQDLCRKRIGVIHLGYYKG